MIRLTVLGVSGSIGRQALEVVDWHPQQLSVVALTAGCNWHFLAEAARRYQPQFVAIADETYYTELKAALADTRVRVAAGVSGICEAAALADSDQVLAAISGMAGLRPLLAAIDADKDIALANKESLVAAGDIVMSRVREKNSSLRPVDSEHSALWQAMAGEEADTIDKLILTASGGAFRDFSAEQLKTADAAAALRHPNWRMGAKITVDCATMVNKGLEVIEAHHLFNVPYDRIDVVVHPESIVHSLISFIDGSVKAQMGWPDMRLPIQYALFNRCRLDCPMPSLDLTQVGALHFYQPDQTRFPALSIMRSAGEQGGTAPAYLNAANEELVRAFLAEKISFISLSEHLAQLQSAYTARPATSIEAVYEADATGREDARRLIF